MKNKNRLTMAAALLLLVQFLLWLTDQYELASANSRLKQESQARSNAELSETTSGFLVISIPAGARVFTSGGRELGTTPCRLEKVEPYKSFVLRAPGYLDYPIEKSRLNHPVELVPGWPRRLLWYFPGLAGLALGALALGLKARGQAEQALGETNKDIAVRLVGPGVHLGPYRLKERLGAGAMAEVFLADNPTPPPPRVAVKVLTEEVSRDGQNCDRFHREAQICQQLRHPGVVSVLAVGQHSGSGRLWMVQELIDGDSLDRRAMPLPWQEVVPLLLALSEALAYAHQAGIVHRDLKPANILMTKQGRPVISDFGLAHGKHYQTITKTDMTLGTPAYMPPEQLTQKRVDGRADLYSLGCIAFELLSGRVPFEHEDIAALLMAHYSQPPPSLDSLAPGLPPELVALVMGLLAKDPAERVPSAAVLASQLRELQIRQLG